MKLLWFALLREALKNPWQLALTILSIAAGVAVVVGVDIANSSALSEFDRANKVIDGVATHRIVGGVSGFDEEVFRLVKVIAGVRNAAPVVSAKVTLDQNDQQFELIGVDPLSDFRIRALSSGLNAISGFESGAPDWPIFSDNTDVVPNQEGRVTVLSGNSSQEFSLIRNQSEVRSEEGEGYSNLLVTDISWAQSLLGMQGALSRIELKLDNPDQVNNLESILPDSVRLVDVQLYNGAKRDMTKAFRINLMALGLLALVIAMFLIYSSVSFQIVRRRKQIGLLRLAGVTSLQLAKLLMLESLAFAAIGIIIGLVLGYVLAIGLSVLVTGTINALYFTLSNSSVLFTPLLALKAGLLGIAATLGSSIVPIIIISRSPASSLLRNDVFHQKPGTLSGWLLPISFLLFLSGLLLLVAPGLSLILSFSGLFLLICSLAVLTPWVIERICTQGRRVNLKGRGLLVKMVILNTAAHQKRTAVAVAALSVAVSATLGVALMIDSFRFSVEQWLEGYLRSDIYLSTQTTNANSFSQEALRDLLAVAGVKNLATGTRRNLITSDGPVTIFVLATNVSGFAGFQIKQQAIDNPWQAFEHDGAILISEPFARHNNLQAGEKFSIPTDSGEREFLIAAVYRDYSSDRGLITMSRSTYSQFFDDEKVISAAVVIEESAAVNAVIEEIRGLSSIPDGLFIRSNKELKETSLSVFDQTFRVTEVLRWLAIVVSVIGIISALMALQLERAREYAILKAVGFSHWQLGGQILLETGVTGLIAGIMAVPLGLLLALSLIKVINVRSYGWSMQTLISPEIIMQSILLAVVAALIAGIYPAWRLWQINISAGLRSD